MGLGLALGLGLGLGLEGEWSRQVVGCGELAVRVDVDLGRGTLVVGGACAQVGHVREVDLLVVGSPRVEGARHLWCHGMRYVRYTRGWHTNGARTVSGAPGQAALRLRYAQRGSGRYA